MNVRQNIRGIVTVLIHWFTRTLNFCLIFLIQRDSNNDLNFLSRSLSNQSFCGLTIIKEKFEARNQIT